jgi:hypothetical protein
MPSEVIDTNVLVVGTAAEEGWTRPRVPTSDVAVHQRVYRWLNDFRDDRSRLLVMDFQRKTILEEYQRNLPRSEHYGRRIVQHKFDTGCIHPVDFDYWANGTEWVAELPTEVTELFHDLGDRKMVAAAFNAGATLVNATDGDWTEAAPVRGLELLGITLVQLLTAAERAACQQAET